MTSYDTYQTPLATRYASKEMMAIFTPRNRASIWRKLWLWLAEAEKSLGVTQISDSAIEAIRSNLTMGDAAFVTAAEEERRRRHDVMAHIYALEKDAPDAAGIIHLGATSCYVTDNADLIFLRDALDIVLPKLAKVIHNLSQFACKYKDLPTLGFTHYQAAQPITVGRRAAQWLQELVFDLEDIEYVRENLKFRGAQGTTGTQASFLEIFQGDGSKVDKLNEILCEKAGFPSCYAISTQTYTRKVDLRVANALSAFGDTAVRVASDIRHLCHDKNLDEPHGKQQVGSSAMPFKSNPMTSERICSLGRKLANLNTNFASLYSQQWLERTLDDSASRRMDIPEMFFLTDAILVSLDYVTSGLVVFPAMIHAQLMQELPFLATEHIIISLVNKHGVSRQEAHEQIRVLAGEAAENVKLEGGVNDLTERIKRTEFFKPIWDEVDSLLDPTLFIGRSAHQVENYAGPNGPVDGKLQKYKDKIESSAKTELSV